MVPIKEFVVKDADLVGEIIEVTCADVSSVNCFVTFRIN